MKKQLPLDTKLPYSFDLHLDCKTMKDLITVYSHASYVLDTISRLLQSHPEIYLDKEDIKRILCNTE